MKNRPRLPMWYLLVPMAALVAGLWYGRELRGGDPSVLATVTALQTRVAAAPARIVVTEVVERPVERVVTQVTERVVEKPVEKVVERVITATPAPTRPAPSPTPVPPVAATPTPTPAAAAVVKASGDAFAPRGPSGAFDGAIADANQRDRHRIEAKQGQLLEVRVKRTSGISLEPYLELVDPSGQREAQAWPSNGEAFFERRLASSGAYTVLVLASGGTGPYSGTWDLDRVGRLTNGAEVAAQLTERGQKDRYLLDAKQGQRLTLRARRSAGISLEPYVELVDPTGQREAQAWPSNGAAFFERQLASSGTYVVTVIANGGAGPYSVVASLQ